jgi:tetratricopeptide (TPR) repeat protein
MSAGSARKEARRPMSSRPAICLNMIVKDEAPIIGRCLRSVRPVVDYYVICDTGSRDDTPDIITSYFAGEGVPGELHRIPFHHFEQARNQALDLCRQSAGAFDYVLLTDADMEAFVDDPAFADRLGGPAYALRQTNTISYYNTRLVRRNSRARYVGVTHEYLDTEAPAAPLGGLWFYDHASGSSRAHKYERDIRLLTEALRQEPDNARSMFYLAQSYKDCGRFEEAITWYGRRVAAGGWEEEVWYSLYMMALCYCQLGDEVAFRDYCLKAHAYRPGRGESLFSLAQHYRSRGMYEEAVETCGLVEKIPYPAEDILFIHDHVYRGGVQEEMSLAGAHCEDAAARQQGYDACLALTTSRQVTPQTHDAALCNFFEYLRGAGELFDGFTVKSLQPGGRLLWPCTNPSVRIDERGTHCVLRTVNYICFNRIYHVLDPDGVYRTRNYFLTLDENFEIRDSRPMADLAEGPERHPFPVEGFEDCRPFFCRGRWRCCCTVRDRNPQGTCEVALLTLDDDRNVVAVDVIRDVRPDLHQKNWVPLVKDDELYWIYTTDPTVVLRYDFDRKQARVWRTSVPGPRLEALRGGSQAVRLPDGWLYVTHEVGYLGPRRRYYMHRFVALGDDFVVRGFTEPFYFLNKGIEFCAGLAYDRGRRQFVASFGCNDREAHLAFLDEASVLARLRPAGPIAQASAA